ncbi:MULTISPECIES: type II secretion system F family protein [Meridianimarinicoccus]|uniref:type II secretion system F family protein n=1 Tax=Meridianimarinicoccus zhengii TaxID=2056810 RepID=UPI000DAD40E6|nr:type II secretion system F family protein [Phycocomes zhengii]
MPTAMIETLVALGAGVSVCALLLAIFPQAVTGRSRFDTRIAEVAGSRGRDDARSPDADDARRRQRAVEKALKELGERQRRAARKKRSLSFAARMAQSRLNWSTSYYYAVSLMVFGGALAACMLADLSLLPTLAIAASAAAMLPHAYVNFERKRVLKAFTTEFPTAIDVIVRGIRSGLPLNDCIEMVGQEASEPLRSEFARMVDDQQIGIPVSDAVQRMSDRMPTIEAAFFATVITMQTRTGGNLSEALSNLSHVMREQTKMHGKIKSMSSEAKTSGAIIGAMPVLVAGMMFLTSPDYIRLLFTTTTGLLVLTVSGVWMLVGIFVMKKMINFDF